MFLLLGLPVAHVEAMRNDARAGLKIPQQLGPQPLVHVRKQVKRNDTGFVNVSVEKIVLFKTHQGLDVIPFGVRLGFLNALRVDIDADAAGVEITGCYDHNPAVAAAQVVNCVAARDAGEFEHGRYYGVLRGHIRNFRIIRLCLWRGREGNKE